MKVGTSRRRWVGLLSATPLTLAIVAPRTLATDVHFDYTSFDNPNTPGISPHFGQAQFNVLNYPSINGNYMMTSTDTHRPEMVNNNNDLAEFYNNFLADYNTQYNSNPTHTLDGAAEADKINSYAQSNSTHNGPRPNWVILNEISSTVWQDATQKGIDYRQTYVTNAVTRLHDVYGFNVVTYAPFATVGTVRAADWQAVAAKSYIGVENYLSGAEVMAGGTDYNSRRDWAQSQYQASVDTYGAAGVDKSRLFLGEHFGNTTSGNGFGRAGISASDWDTVIQIRQDAIRNVGFPGFLAYSWGSNTMTITEAEQIEHEYYYRSRLVLPGQQPQWLSDDAINVNGTIVPLSWGEPLNWIGGVPDAAGAVANFFRTNTTARTITLDGSRSVGTLSFNSPASYTIVPGTGGTLTLSGAGAVSVSVAQGAHTIAAPVSLASDTSFDVSGSLALANGVTSAGNRALSKNGSGTLTIAGATKIGALNITAGKVTLAAGASSPLNITGLTVSGAAKLDLTDNDAIVQNGTVGSASGGVYNGITGLIQSGRNGGSWNGNGIVTSSASGILTTLGVATAAQVKSLAAADTAIWNGQTVSAGDALLMYTYAGDANLDGKIDISDYGRIDMDVAMGTSGWFNGDFNYDGKIDISDYGIIDFNIGIQGAPFATIESGPAAGVTLVPEPVLTPLILCPLLLSRRRRTRSR